jgi:SAM-dependent methyltransferase
MPRPNFPRRRSSPVSQRDASSTSWQGVSKWYQESVGESGHYYHQHIVIPGVLKLLDLKSGSSLLDLACGQGVLERAVKVPISYTGFDAAGGLIAQAERQKKDPSHVFAVTDVTKPLPLVPGKVFSHAACVLALQNMEKPAGLFEQMATHLAPGGTGVIVINHPSFRIPRQSSWGIDESNKLQYRRVNLYTSPIKVPITAHPGQQSTVVTWSFHEPLSAYVSMIVSQGLVIDALEEWVSDKQSEGKAAKMENRGRSEFPLFLALRVRRLPLALSQ